MRVIGHRGALALAPENTFAAFAAGERAGVDAIEFDVQRTRDAVPVVIHDHTVDRTTNGHGAVADLTLADIRDLDAGSHAGPTFSAERVPTLDALLAWAAPRRLGLMLELKLPAPGNGRARDDGLARACVEAVLAHGLLGRTTFISFDHPALAEVLALAPAATVGLLAEGPVLVDPLAPARAIPGAAGMHVRWWWISPALCDAAHREGMHVHAWGLGREIEAAVVRRLAGFGIDSISADDPVRLIGTLREAGLRSARLSPGAS